MAGEIVRGPFFSANYLHMQRKGGHETGRTSDRAALPRTHSARSALDDQRDDIRRSFPTAKTVLSFVCRMNREPIRSPARSFSNLEFHGWWHARRASA
jgi:hypothetical protein